MCIPKLRSGLKQHAAAQAAPNAHAEMSIACWKQTHRMRDSLHVELPGRVKPLWGQAVQDTLCGTVFGWVLFSGQAAHWSPVALRPAHGTAHLPLPDRVHSGVAVSHAAMQSEAHALACRRANSPKPGAHRLQSPVVGFTARQRTGLSQRSSTRGHWDSQATCTRHLPEPAHHTASCREHCTVSRHTSPANPVSQR